MQNLLNQDENKNAKRPIEVHIATILKELQKLEKLIRTWKILEELKGSEGTGEIKKLTI